MNKKEKIVDEKQLLKLKVRDFKIVESKAADGKDEGIIEAYVSVFDVVDSYGDIIERGAFTESLKRKLPKGVWMHNWDEPIAKTIEAKEDAHGLYIKGQLIMTVQRAREAYELMKAGVIDEFSIGFWIKKWEYDETTEIRRIKEIDLVEWSPVLAGANPDTELISVKDKKDAPPIDPEDEGDATKEEEEKTEHGAECKCDHCEAERVKENEEKAGKVLSEKNRALIKGVLEELETLKSAISNAITPLAELYEATEGEKVEATPVEKKQLVRIRQATKQIDKAAEHILRITKNT